MWHLRGAVLPCLLLAVLPLSNGYAALKQPTYEKPVTEEELTSPITKYATGVLTSTIFVSVPPPPSDADVSAPEMLHVGYCRMQVHRQVFS